MTVFGADPEAFGAGATVFGASPEAFGADPEAFGAGVIISKGPAPENGILRCAVEQV